MRNESFEIKLLLNQNSEMFTKLQTYRRDNEQLTRKNQDLNLWVGNLSEVFASLSSAWQLITDCEESLYTLLKKRQDAASKAIIAKYVSHFKVF